MSTVYILKEFSGEYEYAKCINIAAYWPDERKDYEVEELQLL